YGGTAGLVTLEDLVEELVGEIYDEFDLDHDKKFRRLNGFTISVDAMAEIDELNEKFSASIPESETYSTLGGYIIEKLGRIPVAGEVVKLDSGRMIIEKASRKRVIRVKLIFRESLNGKLDDSVSGSKENQADKKL
ncbi:MAG TPA: hypothetical protein ENN22_09265, partial [bacterium]|nr:hypothetical protein [bacterium]